MRLGRKQPEVLFDASKVDLVAESADGIVELIIVADASWTGSDEQVTSLQDKVQTYVSFALDGERSSESGTASATSRTTDPTTPALRR